MSGDIGIGNYPKYCDSIVSRGTCRYLAVFLVVFFFSDLLESVLRPSPRPQVITEALVCFTFLLKFPLPAVEKNSEQLTKKLFVLLKDFSKAGAARGENYHLVQSCFKVER